MLMNANFANSEWKPFWQPRGYEDRIMGGGFEGLLIPVWRWTIFLKRSSATEQV
jgi:hypothetical protein